MGWRIVWGIALAWALMSWVRARPIELPAGAQAPSDPVQTPGPLPPAFERAGYTLRPVATFEIEARVLGREDYARDREADLSPIDLALGWGPMSDSDVLDRIQVSQSGRFYYWRTSDLPLPAREISQHSANMHLIPADEAVVAALDPVREGHVVTLHGFLVDVEGRDGWRWRSSRIRTDTGAGACELIYVEAVALR